MGYKLKKAGIPFTELFIDRGETVGTEFHTLLEANGMAGGVVGTPTMKVNGVLLLNNPPFRKVTENLHYK